MIGYVTLGTNDIRRAAKNRDRLLGALGSKGEGAPGPRGDGWYCDCFRDLDGNKLNLHCFT